MQTVQEERGTALGREVGGRQPGRRDLWLPALLLLDALVLGGITALVLVAQLLNDTMSSMNEAIPGDAFGVIPHVQDKLLFYWLAYFGIAILLGLATLVAYLWLRMRSGRQQI